ncbi:TauD/TfdA family dioxygenase [Streptacidiphilus sp. MAP12-33]|uniref:TauD/TfdA family dioxygenase n=1 Tax=Streptacidiphilus sp. MAP12-33 TaxID=3156266 RepID=UPI003518EF75
MAVQPRVVPAENAERGLLIVDAERGGEAAPVWAAAHAEQVRAWLDTEGAVLLRGLGVASAAEVGAVADALGVRRMVERERFAARTEFEPGLYSSSEWPSDEPMCHHHELSYAAQVPGTLVFGCLTAPTSGGRTQLADGRRVLATLPPALVERFTRDGWTLTRMYHEIGVPWSEAFGTTDRGEVDAYCAAGGIRHTWLDNDVLQTEQRRAAVVRHPRSGEPVWFNQAAFLNGLTLDPAIREYLLDVYGPAGLPFDTAFGDGTPIDAETVETLNAAYLDAAFGEPWRAGDVLVVDNIRTAHSREPFEGRREVVLVLGDPVRLEGHVLS